LEIGPRLSFTTAWSANATAICSACGISSVRRIERSRRILITFDSKIDIKQFGPFIESLYDRMTECIYDKPLTTFANNSSPEVRQDSCYCANKEVLTTLIQMWRTIPLLEEGRSALERLNQEMGLALDESDLDYYTNLFTKDIKRNPTTVECFDVSQSNSEHSRHWFFKGRYDYKTQKWKLYADGSFSALALY